MFSEIVFLTPEPPGTFSGGQLVVRSDLTILRSFDGSLHYIGPEKPDEVAGLNVPVRLGTVSKLKLGLTLRTTPLGYYMGPIRRYLHQVMSSRLSSTFLVFIENTRLGFLGPVVRQIAGSRAKIIFNAHNVEVDYMRTNTNNFLRQIATGYAERLAVDTSDIILTLTRQDEVRFNSVYPHHRSKIAYVPVALPWKVFRQEVRPPRGVLRCLFVGKLDVHQNQQAVRFLLNQVWPILGPHIANSIKLTIVGSSPPRDVFQLANANNVSLEADASQDRLEQLFAEAHVLLAPVKGGSGIKLKVMDAIARGLPVIGSTDALVGYENSDQFAMVADTPSAYAGALSHYLRDTESWQRASKAASKLYIANHTLDARKIAVRHVIEHTLYK